MIYYGYYYEIGWNVGCGGSVVSLPRARRVARRVGGVHDVCCYGLGLRFSGSHALKEVPV